eukprot:1794196-Pleurochrysis_carterae.AAC.1
MREGVHRCKLGRRSHGRERIIHVLTTGLIRAQETEGRWVTRGDEGPKASSSGELSSLAFAASLAKVSVSL